MTDYEQGRVLEVAEVPAGSEAALVHTVGETLVTLYDTSDFSDGGGEALIGDIVYEYLSKDDDLDTLLLASPLEFDLDEDEEVFVHPGSVVKEATVQMDEEDAVMARVPHQLFGLMDTGVREENAQESIQLTMDSGEWVITDLIGQSFTMHGGYISEGSLPDPTAPTTPPAGSPEITDLSGTPGAIIISVGNVEPGTWINYHISTLQGFTEGPLTQVASSQSTVMVAKALADGTPLIPDVTYYVMVQAENSLGLAPQLSEEKSVQLDLDSVTSVIAERLVAGFILTGRIQVGQAYLDANEGIVIPQPDGTQIRLPIDGSSATISAHLIARSLTVEDQWSIFGWGRLGGVMTLQNQVEDPIGGPTLSAYVPSWRAQALRGTGNFNSLYQGLAYHTSTTYAFVRSISSVDVMIMDKRTAAESGNDGDMIDVDWVGGDPITWPTQLKSWSKNLILYGGAFTRIGTSGDYYMIVKDTKRSYDTFIYRINSSWDKVGEYRLGPSNTFSYMPTLTSDGVNLLMLWVPMSTNLTMRTYRADLTGSAAPDRTLIGVGKRWHILGAAYGNFGEGATGRLNVQLGLGEELFSRSFRTDTWARVPEEEFSAPRPGAIRGMMYDAGLDRLVSYNQYGYLSRYSKLASTTAVQAKYTWYDGDAAGGTHESAASDSSSFLIPPRHYLRVETPPAPDWVNTDPLVTDKANRIGVYLGTGLLPPRREVFWPSGVRSGTWESFLNSGVAHPTVTDFDASTSARGSIRSAAGSLGGDPIIELSGGGAGRVGPLAWSSSGVALSDTTTLTLSGVTTGQVTFTRMGGMIYARTSAIRNTWASNAWTTIGTIPSGWRPAADMVTAGYTAANGVFYQYNFMASGTIQLRQQSNHTVAMTSNEFWLA